jgi:hypothetical protein
MNMHSIPGVRASVCPVLVPFLVAIVFLCPSASAATTIFDNTSNGGNGFFGVGAGSWEAQRFNSDATNGKLISAALNLTLNFAGEYRVDLYSDVAGQPGALINHLFDDTTANKPPQGLVQFTGLSQGLLPNTNYWIVLDVPVGQTTGLGWEVTSNNAGTGSGFQLGTKFSTNQGASWSDRSAVHKLQLVADVPEPASAGLLLLGAATCLAARGRRR